MARKNPLTKITDLAVDALKNPRGTAERAVDQVKETSAVARSLATRAAARASDTAGALAHHTRASRHRGGSDQAPAPQTTPPSPPSPAAPKAAPSPQPATESRKLAGDPVKPTTKRTAAKKAPADKPATKKTAAKKPAAQKPAAQKPAAQKPAAQNSGAKNSGAKNSGAKNSGAQKSGPSSAHHEPTPADVAPNIAPNPPTEEPPSTPGDKLPPRGPAQAKP